MSAITEDHLKTAIDLAMDSGARIRTLAILKCIDGVLADPRVREMHTETALLALATTLRKTFEIGDNEEFSVAPSAPSLPSP